MSTKLLPCPFCGSDAEIIGDGKHYFVVCVDAEECGVEGYRALDEGYAVERWNARSKPVAGVEVKPLEWEEWGPSTNGINKRRISERGLTPFMAYFIEQDPDTDQWWLVEGLLGEDLAGPFAEVWQARTAADADLTKRILSTLSLPAQEPARALPSKFRMDGDAAKAISFMLGSSDEDDDTWSDALLWVGNLEDDDGKQVYGLHLENAEYPEEGGITLATFNPQPEAVITEEMVERAYSIIWPASEWNDGEHACREFVGAALTAALSKEGE